MKANVIKGLRLNSRAGIFNWTNLTLFALGVVCLILYRVGLRAKDAQDIHWFITLALGQGGLYLVAAWIIWRARSRRSTLIIVLAFAALFRLSILFAPPYLSDDIYRYVWDGRVQAAGINPYRYIPADRALEPLRDEAIYPKINRKDFAPTIYPPLAQAIYFLVTRVSESVTWMKAALVGFEAITVCALIVLLASFNLPRERVLIYAWHPLLVWEIAGSGHVDAAAIAFIALALLARRRQMETATGVALACAVLIKLFPAVLFPALYRRGGWKMPVAFVSAIVIGYVPYLNVGWRGVLGYLPGYTREEGIQSGARFYLLSVARKIFGESNVPGAVYLVAGAILLLGIAVWFFWKEERDESSYLKRAFILAASFTLVLSPHFPWYFGWLVPFMCGLPLVPFFYLTTVSFVFYKLWFNEWEQLFSINTIVYLPVAILGALIFLIRRVKISHRDTEAQSKQSR
jgi:alpha-1,6-mannosyltransferase